MQKIKENFRRINKKEAKASFYIVENLCYCYIKGVWGVAPSRLMGGSPCYFPFPLGKGSGLGDKTVNSNIFEF